MPKDYPECPCCRRKFGSQGSIDDHHKPPLCSLGGFKQCDDCDVFFRKTSTHNCAVQQAQTRTMPLMCQVREEYQFRRTDEDDLSKMFNALAVNADGSNRPAPLAGSEKVELLLNKLTRKSQICFISEFKCPTSVIPQGWMSDMDNFSGGDPYVMAWDPSFFEEDGQPILSKAGKYCTYFLKSKKRSVGNLTVAATGVHLTNATTKKEEVELVIKWIEEAKQKRDADVWLVIGDTNKQLRTLAEGGFNPVYTPDHFPRGTSTSSTTASFIDNALMSDSVSAAWTVDTDLTHRPIVQTYAPGN